MSKDTQYFTVGELAKKAGTTVRTLQFYDKEGLLHPSARTEGGRRLYSQKDVVRLHQILSFKYLGFSLEDIRGNLNALDTPQEVLEALSKQQLAVEEQIKQLTAAKAAIAALMEEVRQMHAVDFEKYANIISLLKLQNDGYWVVRFLDDSLMDHVKERFGPQPDVGISLYNTWLETSEKASALAAEGASPTSEAAQTLAKTWWQMVMDFTGGDMSLLPSLMAFHDTQESWAPELHEKQTQIDDFIGRALETYLQQQGIDLAAEMRGTV